LWREIGDAFSRLGRLGDDCRCIVLTGIGKAFSSGQNEQHHACFNDNSNSSILVKLVGASGYLTIEDLVRLGSTNTEVLANLKRIISLF
jgi:enoyl-CoA hydratase/carnithine racemase